MMTIGIKQQICTRGETNITSHKDNENSTKLYIATQQDNFPSGD